MNPWGNKEQHGQGQRNLEDSGRGLLPSVEGHSPEQNRAENPNNETAVQVTSMYFSSVESVGRSVMRNRMFLYSISAGSGRRAFMVMAGWLSIFFWLKKWQLLEVEDHINVLYHTTPHWLRWKTRTVTELCLNKSSVYCKKYLQDIHF